MTHVYIARSALKYLPDGAVVVATEAKADTPTCRYVDSKFRQCSGVAVIDVGKWSRYELPRCQEHRMRSPEQSRRNFAHYMYRRACERKLVSQAEIFTRLEDEMEQRLDSWEYWEGAAAGGELEPWQQ